MLISKGKFENGPEVHKVQESEKSVCMFAMEIHLQILSNKERDWPYNKCNTQQSSGAEQ